MVFPMAALFFWPRGVSRHGAPHGAPGGVQIMEPAATNIVTTDSIRRFGGAVKYFFLVDHAGKIHRYDYYVYIYIYTYIIYIYIIYICLQDVKHIHVCMYMADLGVMNQHTYLRSTTLYECLLVYVTTFKSWARQIIIPAVSPVYKLTDGGSEVLWNIFPESYQAGSSSAFVFVSIERWLSAGQKARLFILQL